MKLTLLELDRLPVFGEKKRSGVRKKIGKVVDVVFHPEQLAVIGYVVARPDVLFLYRRKDVLLAFDRATVLADRIVVDGKQAWGKPAAGRLGINWDKAVIWRGMKVRTEGGKSIGYVRDAVIDEDDGRLNGLGLTSGIAADVAVGTVDMPARLVKGWDGSAIVVREEVRAITSDGGAAAVAGRATAVAQDRAEKATTAAVQGAKTAAAYTRSAVRVAAKSDTAKKVGGFLKSMGQQIKDAAGPPNDDD
ncbi:MAG TPA: PRC-barrel domain-containing protein [Candidatus Limnocylindrales bacterium]